MVIVTFACDLDSIPHELVLHLKQQIEIATEGRVIEAYQLNGNEIAALVANSPKLGVISCFGQPKQGKTTTVETITVDEVAAAIEFLQANFGDPLDSKDAFRVRVNKVLYGSPKNSLIRKRLSATIEIFSKLHHAVLSTKVATLLDNTGFTFMMEWSTAILRFKDM